MIQKATFIRPNGVLKIGLRKPGAGDDVRGKANDVTRSVLDVGGSQLELSGRHNGATCQVPNVGETGGS